MNCRHCDAPLAHVFLDLGFAPPSNAYLHAEDLRRPERHYPLRLFVCDRCWLVQTEDYAGVNELFDSEYAYFSSVSTTWLEHAARYADAIVRRCGLSSASFVVEIASNDGYLLKNFVAAGIPCLGVEPTSSTAAAAEAQGIPVLRDFFRAETAREIAAVHGRADLVVGNNVFAHVPDINDFTTGLADLLKPGGTITLEFPHVLRLIAETQFDTVYHEHFSYLSLYTVSRIFEMAGLRVCDVEELPTHGGSLRVYGCHRDDARASTDAVDAALEAECRAGLRCLDTYLTFQARADRVKDELVAALIRLKRDGKRVIAYGAAAKGCTLLNYGGVKPDLLPLVSDAAPSKQGKFLPGSHVPIVSPAAIAEQEPDVVLILPWNIQAEVTEQLSYVREWGGQFMVAVPCMKVW